MARYTTIDTHGDSSMFLVEIFMGILCWEGGRYTQMIG